VRTPCRTARSRALRQRTTRRSWRACGRSGPMRSAERPRSADERARKRSALRLGCRAVHQAAVEEQTSPGAMSTVGRDPAGANVLAPRRQPASASPQNRSMRCVPGTTQAAVSRRSHRRRPPATQVPGSPQIEVVCAALTPRPRRLEVETCSARQHPPRRTGLQNGSAGAGPEEAQGDRLISCGCITSVRLQRIAGARGSK